MLKEDITDTRKNRHQITQEDFTPVCIVKDLLKGSEELFTNFKLTFCDPFGGTGNIFRYILQKRLENCKTKTDIYSALSTLYSVELMEDNVREFKQSVLMDIIEYSVKYMNFEFTNSVSKYEKDFFELQMMMEQAKIRVMKHFLCGYL